MEAKELRLGNYVSGFDKHNSYGKILSIWQNATLTDIEYNRKDVYLTGGLCGPILIESLQPIPLTPEILEKAGFVKGERSMFKKDKLYLIFFDGFYCAYVDNEIKYLHQLQNLYFALTGEELNIEL